MCKIGTVGNLSSITMKRSVFSLKQKPVERDPLQYQPVFHFRLKEIISAVKSWANLNRNIQFSEATLYPPIIMTLKSFTFAFLYLDQPFKLMQCLNDIYFDLNFIYHILNVWIANSFHASLILKQFGWPMSQQPWQGLESQWTSHASVLGWIPNKTDWLSYDSWNFKPYPGIYNMTTLGSSWTHCPCCW